jgi:lysophospholipase L1-like esterase
MEGFEAATAKLNIGWLNDDGYDYHFAGIIDELAIHREALPDDVISRHFMDGAVGLRKGYWGCGLSYRIMPLGDSITARQGYRPTLYFDLIDAGYDIDFVGNRWDSSGSHDRNHEGHSGYTPDDIAFSLMTWLDLQEPDIVLLHIGTNELDIIGVEDILNIIDAYDTNVTVVLARIINRATYHQPTTDFNNMLEAMVLDRIDNGDKILLVDHESALIYPDDMIDELHPNNSGYAKMANVWFNGLEAFLPACDARSP